MSGILEEGALARLPPPLNLNANVTERSLVPSNIEILYIWGWQQIYRRDPYHVTVVFWCLQDWYFVTSKRNCGLYR